jgi:hypothetical protein
MVAGFVKGMVKNVGTVYSVKGSPKKVEIGRGGETFE